MKALRSPSLSELVSSLPQGLVLNPLKPIESVTTVTQITSDSRQVKPGTLFVATKGVSSDGHDFIDKAISLGAIAVIGEHSSKAALNSRTPFIQVSDSKEALGILASAFHDHPSRSMLLIGVTGTSGKTTTTYIIESILKSAGHKVGLIGTVQFRIANKVLPSTHTTPGAVELQELLGQMRDEGCTAVVMEVSSHALKQKRTAGLCFDGMVFTNLTPEHLDYHPDMEDYFQSKAILFKDLAKFASERGKSPVASINQEDPFGARLLMDLQGSKNLKTIRGFSVPKEISIGLDGISGTIGSIQFNSRLTSRFNASNLSAAIHLAVALKIEPQLIREGVESLGTVPGRLESVPNAHGRRVLVDYAHKPDALEKVLLNLKQIKGPHRLITVFGCGGDRDRSKRPVMGKLAAEHSDLVWVTSDNPRTENPQQIVDEIVKGMRQFSNFHVETDRKKAIFEAIRESQAGDIVLIAGKGHEDYQIIGTTKVHFDDREIAKEALQILDTAF